MLPILTRGKSLKRTGRGSEQEPRDKRNVFRVCNICTDKGRMPEMRYLVRKPVRGRSLVQTEKIPKMAKAPSAGWMAEVHQPVSGSRMTLRVFPDFQR